MNEAQEWAKERGLFGEGRPGWGVLGAIYQNQKELADAPTGGGAGLKPGGGV